jgi:hypothetical protein|eukprot:COSAG06_NODE_304_length_17855_cov_47.399414_24_plen_46_part_00
MPKRRLPTVTALSTFRQSDPLGDTVLSTYNVMASGISCGGVNEMK